jgi:RNA polymerase sigma-70 factor, ECF subfamily
VAGTLSRDRQLDLEAHRRELTGFCYRMLGSGSEAEDAVQETMVRAWRNQDRLAEPAALRSWMYRIATNVCLDMLDGAKRRARPMDLVERGTADGLLAPPIGTEHWVVPAPDDRVLPEVADPADLLALRETVRLAFLSALQHLPPKQRACLVLFEVLRFSAAEVAELLETSVPAVNSALQRARATLDALDLDPHAAAAADPAQERELLDRYVAAFERYDIDALVALLHEDATFCMPPYPMWITGREEVARWMLGKGIGCRGARTLPVRASGQPAFASYRVAEDDEGFEAFSLVLLDVRDGAIAGVHNHVDATVFAEFGLPGRLPATAGADEV